MSRSLWEAFQALFRWRERPDEESGEGEDERRFVPSPLDLSVRVAHGGSDDTVVRELSKIEEQARELDGSQHDH